MYDHRGYLYGQYWIGLNDKETEDTWKWESGEALNDNLKWDRWKSGQPNNARMYCFSEVGIDYFSNWRYNETETGGMTTIADCREYCRESCTRCKYFTHVSDAGVYNWKYYCWCMEKIWEKVKKRSLVAMTSGHICPHLGEWIINYCYMQTFKTPLKS